MLTEVAKELQIKVIGRRKMCTKASVTDLPSGMEDRIKKAE